MRPEGERNAVNKDEMLEERIAEWRSSFRRRQAVHTADIEELEDHLRSQVETLSEAGLDADEAFLVAVKRLGDLDSLSREFAGSEDDQLVHFTRRQMHSAGK